MTCSRGFTLLELLVVISLIALATAGVGLSLRDSGQSQLEREAARLAALFDSARAQSRATGVAVRWQPVAGGFRFAGSLPGSLPERWLADGTVAEAARPLVLGPEPLIGAQAVVLRLADQPARALRVSTDGLRPFVVAPLQ